MLDRANHPGTPQAEAEVALAMAHRMMQRHGLGPGPQKASVPPGPSADAQAG